MSTATAISGWNSRGRSRDAAGDDTLTGGQPASPRTVRILGSLSVLLQVGVLWYVSNDTAIGVALAVLLWAAMIGLRLPGAKWLRQAPAYGVLAVGMLLKLNFAPFEISPFRSYLGTDLAYEIATFLILVQLAMLFGFADRRLPAAFSAAGGLAVFLLSDIRVGPSGHLQMLTVTLVYAALAIAQFRLGRRSVTGEGVGWIPILLSGVVALALGGGVAFGLAKYNRAIERSLLNLMGMSTSRPSTGFSTTGDLTTVSERRVAGDQRIALRVYSDEEPGYVNGQSLVEYTGYQWQNPREGLRPVGPVAHPERLPRPVFGGRIFAMEGHTTFRDVTDVGAEPQGGRAFEAESETPLNSGDAPPADKASDSEIAATPPGRNDENLTEPDVPENVSVQQMEIWPELGQTMTYFHPPGQAFLAAQTPSLQMDAYGNAAVEEDLRGQPYTTWKLVPAGRTSADDAYSVPLRESDAKKYLSLPDNPRSMLRDVLDDRLRQILGTDRFDSIPPREKARRIEAYFRENYTYRLGIDRSPDVRRDKTEWFLSERTEGHCEFFASATCLLLRAAGVPTRYSVGFVAEEKNDVGSYWVARNRDAHAWCEAYDEATGRWFVVESTPAGGVPTGGEVGGWDAFTDAARLQMKRWQVAWKQRDLKADIAAASSQLASPTTLLLIGLFAGSAAGYLRYRQRQQESRPELRPLTDLMAQFDRFVSRRGLSRQPGETLRQFSKRVASSDKPWADPAHDWLMEYSRARYREAAGSDTAIVSTAEKPATTGTVNGRSVADKLDGRPVAEEEITSLRSGLKRLRTAGR